VRVTTNIVIIAAAIICRCVPRRAGAMGCATTDVTAGTPAASVEVVLGAAAGTRGAVIVSDPRVVRCADAACMFFPACFVRCGLLDAFFTRGLLPSTSADTSNVQRTRRPARSRGIRNARFDMATSRRNSRTGRFLSRVGGIAKPPVTKRSSNFQLYEGRCTVRRDVAAVAETFVSCSIPPCVFT
jgi:hypothetical protein